MLASKNPASARGFFTPPPKWSSSPFSSPASQRKPPYSHSAGKDDLFHVIHKIPAGDSPYVRAKHVQLIDKDPSRAVSLFWEAINAGDRVDSALKDMAIVMKQLNRSDEAIQAIKSFRHLSPSESQESIDNILIELYKRSGRIEEEIGLLEHKLKSIEEGMAFGGKKTKMARSQGKRIAMTLEKEYSRLLGNLAWAHMQLNNFKLAEENYRKALSFEPDRNKQCNLAICLMHMNKIAEAKFMLQSIRSSSDYKEMSESCHKSLERAMEYLAELESGKGGGRTSGRGTPMVAPFTQPRRSSWSRTSRKLYFENCNIVKTQPALPKIHDDGKWRRESMQNDKKSVEAISFSLESAYEKPPALACQKKKSWADMVEEEELVEDIPFETPSNFNDENGHWEEEEEEYLRQIVETVDINGGYYTQPEESMKHENGRDGPDTTWCCSSPLHRLQLNFDTVKLAPEEGEFAIRTPLRWLKQSNRLQIFQDITPDSP